MIPQLIEKDKALYDWLEKAHAAGEDVIYVSIGTEVQWKQWSVDTIYAGLKELGCKVVWSIRQTNIVLPEENPNFWIRTWIPQVEVLAHPAIKTGITHCGFGGTLEFIS